MTSVWDSTDGLDGVLKDGLDGVLKDKLDGALQTWQIDIEGGLQGPPGVPTLYMHDPDIKLSVRNR